jgi:hypothetical protein
LVLQRPLGRYTLPPRAPRWSVAAGRALQFLIAADTTIETGAAAMTSRNRLAYDADDQLIEIVHPQPLVLETRRQMQAFFRSVEEFWSQHCGNQKVYGLVCLDNVTIPPQAAALYAECLAPVLDRVFHVVVRYGGDPLHRTTVRLGGLMIHTPSRIYATREEALAIVRGLRAGTVSIAKS